MTNEPSDIETAMIMAEIHRWLEHWTDILSERDGPAHAKDFLDSIPVMLNRLLVIMSDED